MKSNLSTAAFLLFFILLFGFNLNSCSTAATRDRFQYTRLDFDAEMCGTVDGEKIEASLKSRPSAEDGKCVLLLSFRSPAALCGLTLSRDASGETEARLGELVLPSIDADGFFEPFLSLVYRGDAFSVRYDGNQNAIVSVCDENCDLVYLFQKEYSYPRQISGTVGSRKIELTLEKLDFIDGQ